MHITDNRKNQKFKIVKLSVMPLFSVMTTTIYVIAHAFSVITAIKYVDHRKQKKKTDDYELG